MTNIIAKDIQNTFFIENSWTYFVLLTRKYYINLLTKIRNVFKIQTYFDNS